MRRKTHMMEVLMERFIGRKRFILHLTVMLIYLASLLEWLSVTSKISGRLL
jgi:hypothetical protein